jgi:hypothetical protein
MLRRSPSTHTGLSSPRVTKHGANRHLVSMHFVFFGLAVVTALAAAVITVAIKSGITVAAVAGVLQ